jgi:hypothetical protein
VGDHPLAGELGQVVEDGVGLFRAGVARVVVEDNPVQVEQVGAELAALRILVAVGLHVVGHRLQELRLATVLPPRFMALAAGSVGPSAGATPERVVASL